MADGTIPATKSKSNFGEFVRTVTRPVLTVIGMLAWIAFISNGTEPPAEFKLLVGAMTGSWFGERFLTRIQGKQP